jgi:DNA-binding MarR family transcriptional regulator
MPRSPSPASAPVPQADERSVIDPMAEPIGASDPLDVALLHLHRLTLATTIHAGNEADPPLTATQVRVLTLLGATPDGMTLTGIAEALSVSPPSASRLCQRLVRDGLVERSAGPGHYIIMTLAQDGVQALRAVNEARVAPLRRLVESVPERRRAALINHLHDLGRRASEQADTW